MSPTIWRNWTHTPRAACFLDIKNEAPAQSQVCGLCNDRCRCWRQHCYQRLEKLKTNLSHFIIGFQGLKTRHLNTSVLGVGSVCLCAFKQQNWVWGLWAMPHTWLFLSWWRCSQLAQVSSPTSERKRKKERKSLKHQWNPAKLQASVLF